MMIIQDELMIHLLCRKKKVVRLEMKNILETVVQNDSFKENVDNTVENNSDSSSLDITERITDANPARYENLEHKYRKKEKDFEKALRKEMTACESEGVRGK
ncbi:hypothetical protein AVEN_103356-1 [Araneus ventricosus]|uniref:Uncharacterized protein n=1 Tax=Araneus ventricosus TaxID=182803 RepID=A0A4Y2X556_ARAVE|nr:hypothetical protein AVEN_103356-1 [Araneus ventricosus]